MSVLSAVCSPFFRPPPPGQTMSAPVGHRPIVHRLPSSHPHVRETRARRRSAGVPQRLAPPSETVTGSCRPRLESGCDKDRGGPWGYRRRRNPLCHNEWCVRIASRGAWVADEPTHRRVGVRDWGLPERWPCPHLYGIQCRKTRSKKQTHTEPAHYRRAPGRFHRLAFSPIPAKIEVVGVEPYEWAEAHFFVGRRLF